MQGLGRTSENIEAVEAVVCWSAKIAHYAQWIVLHCLWFERKSFNSQRGARGRLSGGEVSWQSGRFWRTYQCFNGIFGLLSRRCRRGFGRVFYWAPNLAAFASAASSISVLLFVRQLVLMWLLLGAVASLLAVTACMRIIRTPTVVDDYWGSGYFFRRLLPCSPS